MTRFRYLRFLVEIVINILNLQLNLCLLFSIEYRGKVQR